MADRLDKSLDEIIGTQRRSAVRGGRCRRVRRATQTGKPAPIAPVGGIKKNPKQAKGAVKAVPTGPSSGSGEGKIIVSGLVSSTQPSLVVTPTANLSLAKGCHRANDQGMLSMWLSKPLDFCRIIPSTRYL